MTASLRFGILTMQNMPYPELVQRWNAVEAAGFDSVWVADHFVDPYAPESPWFDGWSLLPAMAAVTSRLQIGAMVTSITLHNPLMLAKQAMTVDHVSSGRLILGIGAGRAPLDHSMTGVSIWETAERVQRFQEFTEITHQLLTTGRVTYEGDYYQANAALLNPAPVQQPMPRLTLAAHGDRTLRLAGRLANSWNTFLRFNATPDEAIAWANEHNHKLDEACTLAGRAPADVSRSLLVGFTRDQPFASREAFRDFIGRYHAARFDEFIFYWTEGNPDLFASLPHTAIPDQTTLEWVAEECAALQP